MNNTGGELRAVVRHKNLVLATQQCVTELVIGLVTLLTGWVIVTCDDDRYWVLLNARREHLGQEMEEVLRAGPPYQLMVNDEFGL